MLPPLDSESLTADGLRWTFTVPADHPFFEGHFPGHPILPGVVTLGWMMMAAERLLGHPVGSVELLNVKFQVVILPGTALELTLARKPAGRLQGIVRSEAGVHASALIPGQEA